jgi:murein DD-endopeptidase MepM/ murein hydrolase activator NlpD
VSPPETLPPDQSTNTVIGGRNDALGSDSSFSWRGTPGSGWSAASVPELLAVAKTDQASATTALHLAAGIEHSAQLRLEAARSAVENVLQALAVTSQARQQASQEAAQSLIQMRQRAVAGFVAAESSTGIEWLKADGDPAVARALSQTAASSARETAVRWQKEVARSDQAALTLGCALAQARDVYAAADRDRVAAAELRTTLERVAVHAGVRVAVLTASSTAGVLFPVVGPVWFDDTWGAERSGGRVHQGVDFIAAWGTPIIAAEGGTVARIGWDVLGGWRVSILGASGTYYYYAHLAAYPEGLELGDAVGTGELLGWVGDTGNASGVPHLHWEVHPYNGDAVNPYPFARALQQTGMTVAQPPLALDASIRSTLPTTQSVVLPRMPAAFAALQSAPSQR